MIIDLPGSEKEAAVSYSEYINKTIPTLKKSSQG
jgi:hypothetical protein